MIDIDKTLLIQIINILFLMIVLNSILFRPVRGIIEERRRKIEELSQAVESFRKNAVLRQEEIERKLKEARKAAQVQIEACRGEAQNAGALVVAGHRGEAEAEKKEQFAGIRLEAATVRRELDAEVRGFAGAMAAKILGRAL